MMDLKTFLQRVTAQTDDIVITTLTKNTGIFWNRGSFATLDDAIKAIKEWDKDPNLTIYYSIGNMANNHEVVNGKTKYRRTARHATNFKCLCFDLDVGPDKQFKTLDEAMPHFVKAFKELNIPKPMIVLSGIGAHVYFPTYELMPSAEWESYSIALRVALESKGLQIDTSKIHEPSMVLRPVETYHKKDPKNPKLVRVAAGKDVIYPKADLFAILQQWVSAKPVTKSRNVGGKGKSKILDAVLTENTIKLDEVAKRCNQVDALIKSGGVTDAAGNPVEEPMWRASLGFAKYCEDPEAAITALAGQHVDFDLDMNMQKLSGWNGTGPTTCNQFELRCSTGCNGCAHKGKIKSPAQLSREESAKVIEADPETGEEIVIEHKLPEPYVLSGSKIMREDIEEVEDDNGNIVKQVKPVIVANYNMYIDGLYKCLATGESAFRLAVEYPFTGWMVEDHPAGVVAAAGKEFSDFIMNRMLFNGTKSQAQKENLRQFLMDYLSMVQAQAPLGYDYLTFGWQKNHSFLCGEQVIGSEENSYQRRLKGGARHFQDIIRPIGSREKWVDAMDLLNLPGTHNIRACVLLGTTGILAKTAGNGSMLISVYSTETTTGKTLALAAVNSLIGDHNRLFLKQNDTQNAAFSVRGTLNNLPVTMDEITKIAGDSLVQFVYDITSEREKLTLTQKREHREPAVWAGPTFTSTNESLVSKYEAAQAQSDPMRARVMELEQHDREFVGKYWDEDAKTLMGDYMFAQLLENNGWAFPELVEAVVKMGGPKAVLDKGRVKFFEQFNFTFQPEERMWRSAIISAWIMGSIGKQLGLFPFDVNGTIQYLLDCTVKSREAAVEKAEDVFDVIGQFLQEHNDQIVFCSEVYNSKKEQVQQPAPEKAVARIKRVYDDKNVVLPGSWIAINSAIFKKWLKRSNDAIDRIEREMFKSGISLPKGRVTMFKGCTRDNPGQANCHMINMNHQRFIDGLTGTSSKPQSTVLRAVLAGDEASA